MWDVAATTSLKPQGRCSHPTLQNCERQALTESCPPESNALGPPKLQMPPGAEGSAIGKHPTAPWLLPARRRSSLFLEL